MTDGDAVLERARRALAGGAAARATREARRVLRDRPGHPGALDVLWRSLARQRRHEEAARELESLVAVRPDDPSLSGHLGRLWMRAGDRERALPLLREAAGADPGDADLARTLAAAGRACGRWALARDTLARAARESADRATRLELAGALLDADGPRQAARILDGVVAEAPDDPRARATLAGALDTLGDFDRALENCRRALALRRDIPGALLRLTLLRRIENDDDPDLALLREAAGDESLSDASRASARFALGKAMDDLGRHGRAWPEFRAGNEIGRAKARWSRQAWEREVAATCNAAYELPEPVAADAGPLPLFIIGMPRSGTTLLEQLLVRLPGVCGRGELNWFREAAASLGPPGYPVALRGLSRSELGRLRRRYLRHLVREDNADVFVDKNPLNFRYLALITRLVPEARFVHVTRDPRDVGLSLYFQPFESPEMGFTYDPDDIIHYLGGYRRMMDHWSGQLAERLVRVDYRELVADTDTVMADVASRLGLDWSRATDAGADSGGIRTASAWQARQPVYRRALERWRRYEPVAPDFLAGLAGPS